MEESPEIMNDPKTFCININTKQVKSLLCETLQIYIEKFLIPSYSKYGVELNFVDIASTAVYEIALKKAIEHVSKRACTTAEVESDTVKTIRVFYRNFETNKSTENIEFVRIVKITGDKKSLPEETSAALY